MAAIPGIISLDAAQSVPRRVAAFWLGLLGAYLLGTIVIATQHSVLLPSVPSFSTAHALALSIVNALTGLVLWSYSVATRQRGYLWLAGAYLYSGALLLAFPLSFPNGLVQSDPPTVLLGTANGGPYIFLLWHLGLLVGIAIGSLLLVLDARTGSWQQSLAFHPLRAGIVLAVLIVGTLALVWLGGDRLPVLLQGPAVSPLFRALQDLLLVATAVVTALVGLLARRRSTISLWLFAVMIVALGESIMITATDERYSLPWYTNRVAGLAAGISLLALLALELGRLGRAAERLAEQDTVTGLMSRRFFLTTLGAAVSDARGRGPVVLLLIDVDDFNSVNDALGNPVADAVLAQLADRVTRGVAPTARVGRLGGDEFAVLLVGDECEDAQEQAARVLALVAEPIEPGDATISLTASIGIARAQGDEPTAESMISSAYLAMRAAKQAGGGQSRWFQQPMADAAEASARLRRELTRALANDEFSVDYQPIVDPATGAATGVEALVRWQDGDRRRAAGEFIGEAERSGQVVPIGLRVIAVVTADLPRIVAAGGRLDVHINLSAIELGNQEILAAMLSPAVLQHRDRVVVEVTESLSVASGSEGGEGLDRLRRAGYRLAVDDFGSGYASMSRLESMRPAVIKADRSIVIRAMSGKPGCKAFLEAALNLSEALNCTLVAEGVERAEQAAVVREMGVGAVQGYYYARPMPLAALLDWLRDRGQTEDAPGDGPVAGGSGRLGLRR